MPLLGFALAALVGLSLGLLGGGGSVLTVPIFVYVLGFAPKQAIAMSLPVVGATSLVGAVGHWRHGNVRLRTALAFGPAAMLGAFAGARAAGHVSGTVQLVLLSLVMLAAAGAMLRSSLRPGGEAPAVHAHRSGRALPVLVASAVGVGALTGLVGIGGGFLIVPALVLLAGVPMKEAIGTSLLVIAMNSAAGFLGYQGRVEVPWAPAALFALVAIGGILVGARLAARVPTAGLKRGFAVFLVAVGAFMLYNNL